MLIQTWTEQTTPKIVQKAADSSQAWDRRSGIAPSVTEARRDYRDARSRMVLPCSEPAGNVRILRP
jgi:hypothetical protein